MTLLSADEVSRVYSERIFDIANTDHRNRKIVCPLPSHQHSNYTPSFSIFWTGDRWRWRCHGNCNKQGDVIDLIGYMQVPMYDKRDSKKLAEAIGILTGNRYEPVAPTPPKTKRSGLPSIEWNRYFPPGPKVIDYAGRRGLNSATLEHFLIGEDNGWMTIPTFHNSKLMGIKMRNLGEGLRYKSVKGSITGLFNFDGVAYSPDRVYVVKGEIAAMVLHQRGLLACAPTGGESMLMTDEIKKVLSFADCVVIGDNDRDPAVRKETSRLAYERSKELNAKLFFPPEEYKDVDEWVLNDPFAIDQLRRL